MKNKFLIFFLSLIVALTLSIEASAAITPGAKCSKAGVKQVYKGKTYTCVKSGKKMVWNKGLVVLKPTPTITATPKPKSTLNSTPPPMPTPTPTPSSSASNPFTEAAEKALANRSAKEKAAAEKAAAEDALDAGREVCIPGSKCPIGSTGPGGGIVFYDAGRQESWGRYLEVAPFGWSDNNPDPMASWCNVRNMNFTASISDVALKATLGFEIGKGKANTDLMVAFCSSGAGVLARAYKGGGKSDWSLPSKDELNELCKYAYYEFESLSNTSCDAHTLEIRSEFLERNYLWSSSENDADSAWFQLFHNGYQPYDLKSSRMYVRPVRAF
jgi:hypothetical protein